MALFVFYHDDICPGVYESELDEACRKRKKTLAKKNEK
jgi:hypothetical protein